MTIKDLAKNFLAQDLGFAAWETGLQPDEKDALTKLGGIAAVKAEIDRLVSRKMGGARPGAGRKAGTTDGTTMRNRQVTLDETTSEIMTEFGDGNLSEGIRRAARVINKGDSK